MKVKHVVLGLGAVLGVGAVGMYAMRSAGKDSVLADMRGKLPAWMTGLQSAATLEGHARALVRAQMPQRAAIQLQAAPIAPMPSASENVRAAAQAAQVQVRTAAQKAVDASRADVNAMRRAGFLAT